MNYENDENQEKEKPMEFSRKTRKARLASLSDYRSSYSIDNFLEDFVNYFQGDVDFDLKKIRKYLQDEFPLNALIEKAIEKNTHPVIEFVQELFKDLGKSGDVEWSGEL